MKIPGWIKMTGAIFLIWGIMKFLPLILNKISTYREITEKSMQLGIDNAALFYTEEKQTSIAELKLKEKLQGKTKK